jgi:hypothetical protein
MNTLSVDPYCLMFFTDETGHEEFADPNYRVFGLAGCSIFAATIDQVLRKPWRRLKDQHFGGPNVALHASDLSNPTMEQVNAIAEFFRNQRFGRFGVTATAKSELPSELRLFEIIPNVIRKRWQDLASRSPIDPVEIAFIHEVSERGDPLLEKYFGETMVKINDRQIPVHQGLMRKELGDEALEVADFIVQAAGRQALRWAEGDHRVRKDFQAIFHANPSWSSFMHINQVDRQK